MVRLHEPTPDEESAWKEWVSKRPENVRRVAEHLEPWTLYRMKSTGHRVTLISFDEHENGGVTLRVRVGAEHNYLTFERQVFGISPDDLEPCELPGKDEPLGAIFTTDDEIDRFINAARPAVLIERKKP